MNIPEIIAELQKMEPDIPLDKKEDIVGFHVIDTDGIEIFFVDYEGDVLEKELN